MVLELLFVVLGSLALVAGAGFAGFAAAMLRASRAPHPDLTTFQKQWRAELDEERARDRRALALALEEATEIEDTVKRARAKVDGAKGGRPRKDEPEQRPLTRDEERDQVLRIARHRGRVA